MTRNDIFLKNLGSKVKAMRQSQGISVRKLGELCKTDYSNLSRFEGGKVNIRMLTLKSIADVLGMDIKEFL